MKKHGLAPRENKHPLYKVWCEMRYRCENPGKHNYKYYGARGIQVCERWKDFANFVKDMGVRPKSTTLDRINGEGNYEPLNCRWADKQTQMNNTRFNRVLTINDERMTLAEASRMWKVPVGTIWRRLELGWGEEDAARRTVRRHKPYSWAKTQEKI